MNQALTSQVRTPSQLPALAAIDLDGTLLGPDIAISAANAAAVAALQRAGVTVVIATGRHFRSALPYARALPGVRWIVSSQGGEVADVERTTVLGSRFLAAPDAAAAIRVGIELGVAVIGYGEHEIFTAVSTSPAAESARAEVARYAAMAGTTPIPCAVERLTGERLHKLVFAAEPERIAEVVRSAAVRGLGLETVRSHARLFEVLPVGVTKAAGLEILVGHLGVDARATIVFGDADNDLPMFAWAGVSVAMPHAAAEVRARATWTGPEGSAEEALARAVARVLKG